MRAVLVFDRRAYAQYYVLEEVYFCWLGVLLPLERSTLVPACFCRTNDKLGFVEEGSGNDKITGFLKTEQSIALRDHGCRNSKHGDTEQCSGDDDELGPPRQLSFRVQTLHGSKI